MFLPHADRTLPHSRWVHWHPYLISTNDLEKLENELNAGLDANSPGSEYIVYDFYNITISYRTISDDILWECRWSYNTHLGRWGEEILWSSGDMDEQEYLEDPQYGPMLDPVTEAAFRAAGSAARIALWRAFEKIFDHTRPDPVTFELLDEKMQPHAHVQLDYVSNLAHIELFDGEDSFYTYSISVQDMLIALITGGSVYKDLLEIIDIIIDAYDRGYDRGCQHGESVGEYRVQQRIKKALGLVE